MERWTWKSSWRDAGVILPGPGRDRLLSHSHSVTCTRPRLHHHAGTMSKPLSRPAPTRGTETLRPSALSAERLSTLVYVLLQKHRRTQDKVSYAHTSSLPQDATETMYAMIEKKVFHPFVSHECVPDLINACILTSSLPDCRCPPSRPRLIHMPPSCRIS